MQPRSSLEDRIRRSGQIGFGLLLFNAVGALIYLERVSHAWAIPEEQGEVPITGEPLVWFAGWLPVVAVFLPLNLILAGIMLRFRQQRIAHFWIAAAAIWLIAVCIDFAHH